MPQLEGSRSGGARGAFSRRCPAPLGDNPLTRARRAAEAQGPVLDLALSSPTAAGLAPDPEARAQALAAASAAAYAPSARGSRAAREAVAAYYAQRGCPVSPERIVLTASTAEAYSALLRLLADPGQAVLVPTPSYPLLFDLLRLEPLALAPYPTAPGPQGWRLDPSALHVAAEAPLAAAIWVNPNNPTGACLHPADRALLLNKLRRRGLPLIADEVFLDYLYPGRRFAEHSFAAADGPLSFCLSGLSKVAGLAGLKLSWIVVNGEDAVATPAIRRLELILDNYLSVNVLAQAAAGALLDATQPWQANLRRRLQDNLRLTERALAGSGWRPLPGDGGWSLVLEHQAPGDDEQTAIAALTELGVYLHPAYLFAPDGEELSPDRCRLVLSLLTPPAALSDGLSRLRHLTPRPA